VKGKKEDKALNELFRQKLGNAEVIPSPSVSKVMMRRLARREFLHFNPIRFNIWYASGVVIIGAAIALILSSGPGENDQKVLSPVSGVINDIGVVNDRTTDELSLSDVKLAEDKRDSRAKVNIGSEKPSGKNEDDGTIKENPEMKENIVSPAEVPSIPEGGLFKDVNTEKNRLQSGAGKIDNLIGASVTEGCTPLKVIFKNRALSFDSCRWIFGDGGHSYDKNPEWLFDVEGEYEVILQVFNQDGNKSFSSLIITVHPNPAARFEITPENAVIPDDEIAFLNYSMDAEKYKWDFGDGSTSELFEPKHSYKRYGNYNVRLIASSEYGCSDSLVVLNAFGSGYYIRFPNAFMPNPNGPSGGYYSTRSDEFAYVFHPVYSGVSDYQLRIFSRRGIQVFESNDVNIGWDGYYKGQFSDPGVYIWKVRGNFINGEPFTLMGDVTLLKNK
jgi:hypothetical protein